MNERALSPQRVASVDTYRGFVMFLIMAEVLHFSKISAAIPDSAFWSFLSFHQSHVPWVGCSLHDLIQPSFSFLVGVALPYSLASQIAKKANNSTLWIKTLRRSLILVLLGIFLRSMHRDQTYFTFEDTLSQIGLGYPILFALAFSSERLQWTAFIALLAGYWLLFATFPLPGTDFNWTETGSSADWEHNLKGFAAHWNKNTNAAWAFDRWFLNLFPRSEPFKFNGGGYSTLSFIPTLATMILGLIAGNWLKTINSSSLILKKLYVTAAILLSLAVLLGLTGLNPIVKRIWTPSWTLFSGAWCFLLLGLFYYMVDLKNLKDWFKIFIVIGSNSILAYVMVDFLPNFIHHSFEIHLGNGYDLLFGTPYRTLLSGFIIIFFEYLLLRSLYNRKVFIRI